MKQFSLIVLSIITLLSSCHKDIDVYDPNTYQPYIGIASIFAQDSLMKVWIYKTASPGNFNNSNIINDANVKLYEDQSLVGELTFEQQGDIGYYKSDIIPRAGHTYKVEVEALGQTAWAVDTLPALPEFQISEVRIIDTMSEYYYIEKGSNLLYVDIDVNLVLLETNNYFYAFAAYSDVYSVNYWYYLREDDDFVSLDKEQFQKISIPVLDGYNNFYLYKPKFYETGDILITFPITGIAEKIGDSKKINFVVAKLSKTLYDFYISYDLYFRTMYNPFIEPVNLRMNVNNGLGLFAGFSYRDTSYIIRF